MKIILISVGSRGDIEPFLTIAELLNKRGHKVICAFPEQFRNLVEALDISFVSLGSEFLDMLQKSSVKLFVGGQVSVLTKIKLALRLIKEQKQINIRMINIQASVIESENPDRVVYHPKALYPTMWAISNLKKVISVSPIPYLHYVKQHTHIIFRSNYGAYFNKLTFKIADGLTLKFMMSFIKSMNLQNINKQQLKHVLKCQKVIYTISTTLFPRPNYWKKNLQILGYHERNKAVNWNPDEALLTFLERHSKILFITFGSMPNPNPTRKTKIILDIISKHNIPTIINTFAGGLEKPMSYNKDIIHFVSQIPYNWIFPKMYAVIHHGGSGTTHMAMKNGCVNMAIPHIVDQYVWNKVIFSRGVGPKGIKIAKLKQSNLEPKILDLMNNPDFKIAAKRIKAQMKKENYIEILYKTIIDTTI